MIGDGREDEKGSGQEKPSSSAGTGDLAEAVGQADDPASETAGGKKPGGSAGRDRKRTGKTPRDAGDVSARTKEERVEEASAPEGSEETGEARGGREKPGGTSTRDERRAPSGPEAEKAEMDEEEFRRLVEESLERVTVAEVTLAVMNQFASLGYLRMGLPESVNLKYRDLSQALLAIDLLEAMIKGAEGKIPEESLKPFRGTLANLQLNYVQLKKRTG
jgi:hypothetical protein